MAFHLLLFLGYFAAAQAGVVLNCTNDYENISCQLSAKRCLEYAVDIRNDRGHGEYNCSLKRCNSELCCCSVKITFIPGENYTVETFNGSQKVDTKTLDLWESFKPKTPTNVSVKEYEGIFTVNWKTNMGAYFVGTLTAEVTVSKKGEQGKVYENIRPATVEGLQSFDINGQDLEPGTAYVVSVRSYTDRSQMFSDRSQEYEFQTPPSKFLWILRVIIAIGIGIILLVSVYCCVVRVKRKWWDSYSEPKKLFVFTRTPEILCPSQIATSLAQVKELLPSDDNQTLKMLDEQRADASGSQNSSGIDIGSFDPGDGQTEPPDHKAIINTTLCEALKDCIPKHLLLPDPQHKLLPVPQYQNCQSFKMSSASSGIVNPSYFMSGPSSQNTTMEQKSAIKLQDDLSLSCKSDTVNYLDEQVPACLLSAQEIVSKATRVDMSYQPCKVNIKGSSYAETASLSSTSNGNITSASCGLESKFGAGFDRSEEPSADSVKEMLTLSSCPCPSVMQIPPFPTMSTQMSFPVVIDNDYTCV